MNRSIADEATTSSPAFRNYRILIPLFVGIFITLTVTALIRDQENSIARLDFTMHASDAARSVYDLFTNSINATIYLSALYNSSNEVSRNNFDVYAKNLLEVSQEIQALEWIPRIEGTNLADFEKRNKLEVSDFSVTEKDKNGQLVPVLNRQVYFPVQYVFPVVGNKQAIGYDIASDMTRKKMLIQAHDDNNLTASSRIRLVQEKGDSFGILVTMPVFIKGSLRGETFENDKNLRGYVLGVYRINAIIEKSLLKGAYVPSSFRFMDRSSSPDERLLYKREMNDGAQNNWFTHIENIRIAGRNYSIQIREKPEYFFARYRTSNIFLLAGLVITILFAMYISLIRKTNAELYKSNHDLIKVMDEIKTLKGSIPICAYCHSIRDDEGAWQQLESYISKYSDVSFSHGICPKCLIKVRSDAGLD